MFPVRTRHALCVLLASVAVPGFSKPLAAQTATSVAEARAAILEASRAFSQAYVAGDTATLAGLYSEDALLMPPEGDLRGHDAIAEYFHAPEGRRPAAHGMDSRELRVEGGVAVDVGDWWVESSDGERFTERYLIVWVRQFDGWKIAYDMWHRP